MPCSLLLSVCLRWAGAWCLSFPVPRESRLSCRLLANHSKQDLMIPVEGRYAVLLNHLIRLGEPLTRLLVLADVMVRHGSGTPDSDQEPRCGTRRSLYLKLLH